MPNYPDIIERLLLQTDLMTILIPTEPINRDLLERVRKLDPAELAEGQEIKNESMLVLLKGALFFGLDALDEAHKIFQDGSGDLASYWHGMIHRRESDFDNARYWFRRTGELPFFSVLHRTASNISPTMARQSNWTPYLFTGQCEQVRFGDSDLKVECVALQRAEFEKLLDYTWRQAVG